MDYHNVYLAMDTMQLADVWQNFKATLKETHELDVSHYYTIPGYSWDALLLKSGQKLELLSGVDMLLIIEKGTRGGITQATHRYAVANNPYMKADYDSKRAISYIKYLDANNLYRKAMSAKLPCGGFEWIDGTEDMITEWDENGDIGYFFEVDVKYPRELHELHNTLPFLPERMLTNDKAKVKKLVPNLRDKKNYVCHVAVLKQALKHGLVLEKINRTIKFEQKAWMKDYIDFNTVLRTNAKNDFEKDLFKLMNNSVFGKTMENLCNRCEFYLLDTEEKILLKAREPNFKEKCIFSDYLAL